MSYTQEYNIESLVDFAYRIYLCSNFGKKRGYDSFIKEIFENVIGIGITKIEDITLIDDPWYGDGKGKKITFDNGSIYIHKLTEQYTSNGNYSCDTYKLVKENEPVKIKEINENYGGM